MDTTREEGHRGHPSEEGPMAPGVNSGKATEEYRTNLETAATEPDVATRSRREWPTDRNLRPVLKEILRQALDMVLYLCREILYARK